MVLSMVLKLPHSRDVREAESTVLPSRRTP